MNIFRTVYFFIKNFFSGYFGRAEVQRVGQDFERKPFKKKDKRKIFNFPRYSGRSRISNRNTPGRFTWGQMKANNYKAFIKRVNGNIIKNKLRGIQ